MITNENKLIVYKPYYDIDENGGVYISNIQAITIESINSICLSAYSLIWSKGWTTLSEPSSFEYNAINFGKCTDYEIALIKEAIKDIANISISLEVVVINPHKELDKKSELEAREVIIEYTGDHSIDYSRGGIYYPDILLLDLATKIKSNTNPYTSDKKCDIFTYRYKDGYVFSYKNGAAY